jgi:hypothetical protein
MSEDRLFAIFAMAWFTIGLGSWLFFRKLSVADRRKWHPRLSISAGILFVVFVLGMAFLTDTQWRTPGLAISFFALLVASVSLIAWLNIRFTKFCDSCGAMLVNTNWFQKFEFCQKCGTRFNQA